MATFWETASHSDSLHICSLCILTYCQLLSTLILGRDFGSDCISSRSLLIFYSNTPSLYTPMVKCSDILSDKSLGGLV